ncbi:Delta(5) desaturase DesA [Priestia megaterium]|jgi:omega-6 fatty acid desaturase (delta-12 desaturase)|uniref:fatty acid desaturase n=2 Tax=Priestia megaterium TaxID=1404 RepID=UPI0007098A4C|nr:fatty acid desaturase [Priestia megaterium]KRD84202.1 fatty acid desaturase [Bacillus sp. Root147]MBE2977113.1 fatty acid desaturase [Priestia megaterium]MBT2256564.1 fatty acid desaturase [Priestia megaterium]MBT2278046.1 fatty acid desaturase [Priestia megaterium]MCY9024215.1 fatty acid desaturase [Priestia megaterium]
MTIQKQKNLRKQVAPFEKAVMKDSIRQLINTFLPFFTLWFLAYESLSISYFLAFPLTVIAAGFLVRIFIIFHDCCHYSFFKSRQHNKILGTITGVLTMFPYSQWGHSHAIHHATSSNLDKRGTGDIWVLTVTEYKEASIWKKIAYRIYRNPFIMFGVGPIYVFLITNRFNQKNAKKKERMNTYLTNVLIVALAAATCWLVGWQAFLLIQGPIFFISGSIGIWLFYVQHQFEDSYFEEDEHWDYVKAAVEGSSFYKLPKLLQWLTGNIGFHHVHHLSPRVPNYKLEAVHQHTQPLQNVPTITLATSLRSLRFRLWDEENKMFVSFKEIKTRSTAPKASRISSQTKAEL